MISTDFAPNESIDDALLSLKLLFQPSRWQKGNEIQQAKNQIQMLCHPERSEGSIKPTVNLFLTGRAALFFYLQSLNLPNDADVIIQAFTCEAVPLPIIAAGLKPIYIDIEPETYSMDISDLKKKITPNAKVLILQHTFGFTPQYRKDILAFAKEEKLIVLEDLAHGWNPQIFSKINDRSSYLLSFGRSKAFSSVFGGAIVTNDVQISKQLTDAENKLQIPSTSFIIRALLYKPLSVFIKSTYDIYLGKILHKILHMLHLLIPEITTKEKRGEYDSVFAKAYPNALALLLLHQLKKYPEMMKQRKEIVKLYDEHIHHEKSPKDAVLSRYPLIVENRDAVLKKAAQKNIFLGKWYNQVVAPKQLDLENVQYSKGSCPIAEEVSKKIVNLHLKYKAEECLRYLTMAS